MDNENIKFFLNDTISNTLYDKNISHYTNDAVQLELYYKTHCNVKTLTQILNYYGIYKNKMVKDEMLQVLVFFETDQANSDVVFRRIRRWQYIEELKADSYFSKYIMF
jgi:hypothetical protein